MDSVVRQQVERLKKELDRNDIRCLREKEINYGCQLVCTDDTAQATVAVYHGKKGLSVVIQGKDTPLKRMLTSLAGSAPAPQRGQAAGSSPVDEPLHPQGISCWMGCDESGKGDVFGPLVCAACLITAEEEHRLQALGVCDSKLLSDKAIAGLAQAIRTMLQDRCIVSVLQPEAYNTQYMRLRKQGKNLNHLLGSLHGQNINVLLSKHECPCIIVDKFGKDEYVLSALQEKARSHQIIQVTKGERDTAVAAASVLARHAFVEAMHGLAVRYGMVFPKGAYLGIHTAIQAFRKAYGDESLCQVGKLNFKNFDFLR